MDFSHFVQLIAIGLQARIPMHMTGFPGVGKTEFTKSLEAGFTRAGVKCKVFILVGSIREPQDFGGFPVSTPDGVRLLPMAWARDAKRLAAHGVDRVLSVTGPAFDGYLLETHAAALDRAAEAVAPRLVLLSASVVGKELGATAAARRGTSYVADVTGVRTDGDGYRVTKPVYAGKALATVRAPAPAIVTLRPNALPPAESPREAKVEANVCGRR